MAKRYCNTCGKATDHIEHEPLSFFEECAIALITKFGCDLRHNRYECVECGDCRHDGLTDSQISKRGQ